jgi:hypothetical protein
MTFDQNKKKLTKIKRYRNSINGRKIIHIFMLKLINKEGKLDLL